jgi:putative oxidoreductase
MYKYSILVGRILYSLIFILGSLNLFTRAMIDAVAAQGLPMARFLVPLAGILALWGGMSVALGYKTRVGACLLMLFLVPVTIKMHNFWAVQDPFLIQIQMSMFFKNVSMFGAALLIYCFGPGPVSFDAWLFELTRRTGAEDQKAAA